MEMTKRQALEKMEELKEFIENCDKKDVKWMPRNEEVYFIIENDGEIRKRRAYYSGKTENNIKSLFGVFPTAEKAQATLDLFHITRPKRLKQGKYFCVDQFNSIERVVATGDGDGADSCNALLGNNFDSREGADEFDKELRRIYSILSK